MFIKVTVLLPHVLVTSDSFGYPVYALWFYFSPILLHYLAFQSFDFERTWWRLFQKRIEWIKFDIYAFIDCRTTKILNLNAPTEWKHWTINDIVTVHVVVTYIDNHLLSIY